MRPPTAANTAVASAGGTAILWLGPDEWLVIGQEVAPLRAALAGIHSAVVDVTSSRKALVVSGERAEEILSKAATLDFSVGAFPGRQLRAEDQRRAHAGDHLWRRAAQEFVIYVRSSFAPYLRAWLDDAAQG